MINYSKAVGDANRIARDLRRKEAAEARKHGCKVFSRGFELLALDADGERMDGVAEPDYLEDGDVTIMTISQYAEYARERGAVSINIGYGVDASETREAWEAGDYEPMYGWADLEVKL